MLLFIENSICKIIPHAEFNFLNFSTYLSRFLNNCIHYKLHLLLQIGDQQQPLSFQTCTHLLQAKSSSLLEALIIRNWICKYLPSKWPLLVMSYPSSENAVSVFHGQPTRYKKIGIQYQRFILKREGYPRFYPHYTKQFN